MSSVPPPLVNKLLHLRCSTLLSTVLWNGSLVRCLSHRPRSDMELGEKAVMNLTGLANPSLGNPSSGCDVASSTPSLSSKSYFAFRFGGVGAHQVSPPLASARIRFYLLLRSRPSP